MARDSVFFANFASMKHNNSPSGNDTGKLAGLILLALIWVWLVYMLFSRGGFDLRNILTAAFSGMRGLNENTMNGEGLYWKNIMMQRRIRLLTGMDMQK